jgi:4-amino-4-deoxy-L-arabinose transferase-like glycosyltransferase
MRWSAAMKRYNWRVVWLSLLYAAFLIIAVYGFKHQLLRGAAAYLAAILPALPIIGIFGAMGRYLVEEQDEYVRMLLVRQTLWASGFALSLATIWGFLESFELVDHIDSYYIAIIWFFGLGIGAVINKVTLGATVRC